jgi:hypothetical protein
VGNNPRAQANSNTEELMDKESEECREMAENNKKNVSATLGEKSDEKISDDVVKVEDISGVLQLKETEIVEVDDGENISVEKISQIQVTVKIRK